MRIYGLFDPHTGELRYVGQTKNSLKTRLRSHIQASSLAVDTYKVRWIKKLLSQNLKPIISEIQQLNTLEELPTAEMYWIKFFKNQGCRLTNSTDGGEGVQNPSLETRLKIAQKATGRKMINPPWNKGQKIPPNEAVWRAAQKRSVPVIDDLGNEYLGFRDAALALNTTVSRIGDVIAGRLKRIKGRTFKYKITPLNTLFGHAAKSIIDDLGNIYISQTQAAQTLNCDISGIYRVLRGQLKSIKGRRFKYINDPEFPVFAKPPKKPHGLLGKKKHYPPWNKGLVGVKQKTNRPIVDGFNNIYSSVSDAATQLKCSQSAIRAVLTGRRKQTMGRIFRYAT